MIEITDRDIPITVAQKIITGTKPSDATPLAKAVAERLTGEKCETMDMFSLEEIKEISDYLLCYYNNHLNGD